jgi:hypothetical protein
MNNAPYSTVVLFAWAVLPTACGQDTSRGPGTEQDVELVAPPLETSDEAFTLSANPIYTVGWTAEEPVFESPVSAALMANGRVTIADGGRTLALVTLSADGNVDRVDGRPGDGPGEFRSIHSLVSIGDTLVVLDNLARRVTVMYDGRLLRDFQIGDLANLSIVGGAGEGSVWMGMPLALVMGRNHEAPWLQVPIVRLNLASAATDTILTVDWDQSLIYGGNNPFRSTGVLATSASMIVVGRTDKPELHWYDPSGELIRTVRWKSNSVPVGRAEWDTYSAHRRAAFRRLGLPDEDISVRLNTMRAGIQEPMPLYGSIFGDAHGNIWLGEYVPPYSVRPDRVRSPPSRYAVFSPDGRMLGRVQFPEDDRLSVLAAGYGRVVGVVMDHQYGAPAVRAYELIRTPQ